MSIPKIIHLCWFGRGEYPELAKKCINSWKKYLPDYDIVLWNEDKFDVMSTSFTAYAYKEKKWAFVSDYVRLKALFEYGGVYMDTDLEVIRDFSYLLEGKRYVTSTVEGNLITCGFFACERHHPFIKDILDYYDNLYSIDPLDLIMNPLIFTKIAIKKYNFKLDNKKFENNEIMVLPMEYFMPYRKNKFGRDKYSHKKYHISSNTYTIHHDMGSWAKSNSFKSTLLGFVRLIVPEYMYIKLKERKSKKSLDKMT